MSHLDTDLLITLFSNAIMFQAKKDVNFLFHFVLTLTMLPRLVLNFWVCETLLLILWGNQDDRCTLPAASLGYIFKPHASS